MNKKTCRNNFNTLLPPCSLEGREQFGEVYRLNPELGVRIGATDGRASPVTDGDSVYFSPDLPEDVGDIVVVARQDGTEVFVAVRVPIELGSLYYPCQEGIRVKTSLDGTVAVVGVVTELRRKFIAN